MNKKTLLWVVGTLVVAALAWWAYSQGYFTPSAEEQELSEEIQELDRDLKELESLVDDSELGSVEEDIPDLPEE